MSTEADNEIQAEIKRIQSMTIAELRALWRAKLNSEPPEAFGPDLLRRSIVQKLQEDAYAKRTSKRMLSATRKRHAHRQAEAMAQAAANETETSVRNEAADRVRNELLTNSQKPLNNKW